MYKYKEEIFTAASSTMALMVKTTSLDGGHPWMSLTKDFLLFIFLGILKLELLLLIPIYLIDLVVTVIMLFMILFFLNW